MLVRKHLVNKRMSLIKQPKVFTQILQSPYHYHFVCDEHSSIYQTRAKNLQHNIDLTLTYFSNTSNIRKHFENNKKNCVVTI